MLNLDTHILIHAFNGDLSAREKRLLSSEQWSISAIVLWEIAKLQQLGRIQIELGTEEFEELLRHIYVWPIDLLVARASTQLDIQSDPADELILATSVVHRVPLLTRDRRVLSSKLGLFA
jgi:PIN domain nuclease of toxin-antitoxin system